VLRERIEHAAVERRLEAIPTDALVPEEYAGDA
jgi:hypothetical protein